MSIRTADAHFLLLIHSVNRLRQLRRQKIDHNPAAELFCAERRQLRIELLRKVPRVSLRQSALRAEKMDGGVFPVGLRRA